MHKRAHGTASDVAVAVHELVPPRPPARGRARPPRGTHALDSPQASLDTDRRPPPTSLLSHRLGDQRMQAHGVPNLAANDEQAHRAAAS